MNQLEMITKPTPTDTAYSFTFQRKEIHIHNWKIHVLKLGEERVQNRTLLKTGLCIQAARLKLGAVVALLGLLLLELAGEVREPRAEGAHEVLLLVLQQGRGAVLDLVQRLHLERKPRCDDVQFQLRENVMTCCRNFGRFKM